MTPQHASDPDEFGDAIAKTPPPEADSRACYQPVEESSVGREYMLRQPEERKPASVWDILRWLWKGR